MGGLSKLLKYVIRSYPNKTIMSYADVKFGIGIGYKRCGFNYIGVTDPGYSYFKNGIKYSRQQFQKHKLHKMLINFDPSMTEWENMQINGYDRIWDCGNIIYLKH